jgi:cysteine desulfurase
VIAWDVNAGAPLRPEVARLLADRFADRAGNPSSVHALGRRARAGLDAARAAVARALHASSPREIIFTGSGSEAAALAVLGSWEARPPGAPPRVVLSAIEHPCVLLAAASLERRGAQVVRVPPGPSGAVPWEALRAALEPPTFLCSLMAVNNETGVAQPVELAARWCRRQGVRFHTDAVQAVGRRALPAEVDLLSLSAHKLGGPAGVGVLYDRRGVDVAALTPGHQEDGRRGGTPSVPLAEAAALALELALAEQDEVEARVGRLRDAFEAGLLARWPGAVTLHGRGEDRVAGTSSVRFQGVDAEALLIALDLEGILASTGAACASGSLSPSHVLLAMGLSAEQARSTLRFSLGAQATADEVAQVLAALERHLPACRR